MENILQEKSEKNIYAVFAVTDDIIQGSKTAIEAAGLEVGKDILTPDIDGTRAPFEDVKSGEKLASVTCSSYFGSIVVDTITKIVNGETIPDYITNIVRIITN